MLLETGWIARAAAQVPWAADNLWDDRSIFVALRPDAIADLPGLEELRGSGLLDGRLPPEFSVPMPSDDATLREDEDPLEPGDLDLALAPPAERIATD